MSWVRRTFEISHTNHTTITSMEGIRGFAVFLVFLVHYGTLIEPWLRENSTTYVIARYLQYIGNTGVDIFFVLSGYLIYGVLIKKHKPFIKYIIRRIQRIYPTFTVVFIIYLALGFLFPYESKLPSEPQALIIFLVQNYLLMPGIFDVTAMITVAWSLSYEFFYYLLMPILISSLSMRTWKRKKRVTFFLIASFVFFTYFALVDGPIRLLMFVSGIILYETIESNSIKNMPPLGLPALLTALTFAIVVREMDANGWWNNALFYVLFFVFYLECFLSSSLLSQLFSIAPLRWLGNMSYSYYLIHGLTLKGVFILLEKAHPALHNEALIFWLLLPVSFLITLIIAGILFVYIEKPYSLDQKKESGTRTRAINLEKSKKLITQER